MSLDQPQHVRRLNLPHDGLDYLFSRAGGTSGSFSRDVAVKIVRVYHQHRLQFSARRLAAGGVLLDRPIFLLGVPGSGATLIGRCLRRNRQVVSMSGNSEYWTGADEMGVERDRMRRLPRSLWGNRLRDDIGHP